MEREERGGEGRREGKERREEGEAVVKEIGSSKERGNGEGGRGGWGDRISAEVQYTCTYTPLQLTSTTGKCGSLISDQNWLHSLIGWIH